MSSEPERDLQVDIERSALFCASRGPAPVRLFSLLAEKCERRGRARIDFLMRDSDLFIFGVQASLGVVDN